MASNLEHERRFDQFYKHYGHNAKLSFNANGGNGQVFEAHILCSDCFETITLAVNPLYGYQDVKRVVKKRLYYNGGSSVRPSNFKE